MKLIHRFIILALASVVAFGQEVDINLFDYTADPLQSATSKCALMNFVVDETDSTELQVDWLEQVAIPEISTKLYGTGYQHVFVCGNGFGKKGKRRDATLYRFMGCTKADVHGILIDASVIAWDNSASKPEDGWLALKNAMENLPAEIEGTNLLATCRQFVRTLILFTDSDRDDRDNSLTLDGLKSMILQNGYILNAIVETDIDQDSNNFALKIGNGGQQNTIVTADGNGGWTTQTRDEHFTNLVDGKKDTPEDYIPLVIDTRGMLWNAKSLEIGIRHDPAFPNLLDSFADHFIRTKVNEIIRSQATGDPHITTWKNKHFEYHGQCDLVMAKDPDFANGLGLEVQIRTKLVRYWSYIKAVAIKIGNDILEIEGSADADDSEAHYWINFEYQGELDQLAGVFPITQQLPSVYKRQYKIDLSPIYSGNQIEIKIFKEFVSVEFAGSEEAFGKTVGLVGNFDTGKTFARDGVTVLQDLTEFGDEWQVLPSTDSKIFHEISSQPQFPNPCIHPEDAHRGDRQRRLMESSISWEQAVEVCATLEDPLSIKDCVYDVMATQDLDMVGAYY